MNSPVFQYLNSSDRKEAGAPVWQEIVPWVIAQGEQIEKELASGAIRAEVEGDRVRRTVHLPSHVRQNRDHFAWHLMALERRLIAAGWNTIEEEQAPGYLGLNLSALVDPIVVVSESGEFIPNLGPGETATAACKRISLEGAWMFTRDGGALFIPPHRIQSIREVRELPEAALAEEAPYR